MPSSEVYLVYQNYGATTEAWFGPGGVKDAIDQACAMPNYTGARKQATDKRGTGGPPVGP